MKATKALVATKNQASPTTPNSIATDKVAIFGGSFDPPHLAHFEIILWLSKIFGQVIVIPAYQNPLKTPTTIPLQTRLQWCKKMCENIDNVIISDIESRNNRVMFACELARHFYVEYFGEKLLSNKQKSQNFTPPLYFVIGEDCLADLYKWKNIDELSSLVEFVVFQRAKTSSQKKISPKKNEQRESTKTQKSSQKDFDKAKPNNANLADLLDFVKFHYVDFCPNALLDFKLNSGDISSTFLRKSLKQNLNNQNNNEKILQALPKNLRDEVLAFFAKTSLQF